MPPAFRAAAAAYRSKSADPFSALTLLVGRQEGHPACKKTEWWGVGVVVCLERGADLHTAQLMPLPVTVSCFSKIQIGFTFLVLAYPGSSGKRAVKRLCVCICCPRPTSAANPPAAAAAVNLDRRTDGLKGKVFPYSLPSVGPGADPGVQAVSPQVT